MLFIKEDFHQWGGTARQEWGKFLLIILGYGELFLIVLTNEE